MVEPYPTPPQVVLIVEDDLDLLDAVKGVLVEEAHIRVLTAAVPDLAMPVIEAALPAMVILDIGLPGMSGWEVLAALRQHPRFRTLPVLIVSGMPDASARVAQLQDPWVDFLAKPFNLEMLLEQVQTLVARHRRAAESPPAPDSL
jgi:DNA-binding response OmpR family regulator